MARKLNASTALATLALGLLMAGCGGQSGDYVPAATLTEHGWARDADALRLREGQVVRVSGFVDHGNLYGDESARKILGGAWSGNGPRPGTWRFNLKAHASDGTGESFAVHVQDDAGRDALLQRFAEDAAAGRATPVRVAGRLHTFPAPGNLSSRTGLVLEVASSADVRLPCGPA